MSTLASVFGYGLLSARAAAAVAGRFYYATDTTFMYRDNGSTWDTLTVGAGSMATDALWDAAGDLAQGTGANTGAKLSAGTAGQFLKSGGAAAANTWASRELDYVEYTSGVVAVTATVEASANTLVTGSAVAYDGSTPIIIEFFCPRVVPNGGSAGDFAIVYLFDGSSSIGLWALEQTPAASSNARSIHLSRRLTPSNASHTYSVRAITNAGTSNFYNGAAGAGIHMPMFIRITRAV